MSSLSSIFAAAESLRTRDEAFGVMLACVDGHHVVRVVVGREIVAHVQGQSREQAIDRALDELRDANENISNLESSLAIARACSW